MNEQAEELAMYTGPEQVISGEGRLPTRALVRVTARHHGLVYLQRTVPTLRQSTHHPITWVVPADQIVPMYRSALGLTTIPE